MHSTHRRSPFPRLLIQLPLLFAATAVFAEEVTPVENPESRQSSGVTVVINEVMASNRHTIVDPDFGDASDWVELYNYGSETVSLGGLNFSDRLNNLTKWEFPQGTLIAPGEYLLIWCDNRDFVGKAIHTNFALSASGEDAVLYDPANDLIIDSVSWDSMATDSSLARFPDVTGAFIETVSPTPGASNDLTIQGARPSFSVESGFFDTPFQVEISAPGSQHIRYTLDGSFPTTISTMYTGPIQISDTTGLRARAWYSNVEPSRTRSASYFFGGEADREIPVINIVVDPADLFDPASGIYANPEERGIQWEREVHVAFFSADGEIFESTDAGLRIHGGHSRGLPKKSFRLYFRNDYGQYDWSLPWFGDSPVDSLRHIVLRGGGNDSFFTASPFKLPEVTYLRDQLGRDWFNEMGHYAPHGFFAALYINGEYWGLYNPTERISGDLLGVLGSTGDDWDIPKAGWGFDDGFNEYYGFTEAGEGDLEAWNAFLAWQDANDIASPTVFEDFKEQINLDNFMMYMALNITMQNEDWPHNNWIVAKERDNPASKWRFIPWDLEWGLGLRPNGWESDTINFAMGDNFQIHQIHQGSLSSVSKLFAGNYIDPDREFDVNGVLNNSAGLRSYVNASEDLMNFAMAPNKAIADMHRYANMVRSEIHREVERWEDDISTPSHVLLTNWEEALLRKEAFFINRPVFLRNLMNEKFNLGGTRTIRFETSGTGEGTAIIRGREVNLPWEGTFFHNSQVSFRAIPGEGSKFESVSGYFSSTQPEHTFTVTSGSNEVLILSFESTGITNQWMIY